MVRAQTVYAVGGYAIPDFASPDPIGSSTPNSGVFTTLAASGAVTGAGFTARFSAPGAIGDVTPSAGAFTSLSASNGLNVTAGTVQFTPTGSVTWTYTGNSTREIILLNANAGASTGVGYSVGNGTYAATFSILGTGNSLGGVLGLGVPYIYTNNISFAICAEGTGTIKFAAGGTTEVAEIKSTGLEVTGTVKSTAGTGTAEPVMVGTISVNTTAVGNVGAGTDDLMTYSLPANSLSANGKGVRITAWGTYANNANAKTLALLFGATTINTGSLTISQSGLWRCDAFVLRTGSSTQKYFATVQSGTTTVVASNNRSVGTAAETDAGAITIKFTGVGVSDNDIVQEGMIVEFIS